MVAGGSMIADVLVDLAIFDVLFVAGALGRAGLAALAGMRVEAIVFGVGPPLARWRRFQLAAIPLGAFCRVAGFDPCESPVSTDDPRAFHHRPLLLRLLVALGWPIGAQVLVAAFASGLLFIAGVPSPTQTTLIGGVEPGWPGEAAGLRSGDEILAFDGRSVDMAGLVRAVDAAGERESTIEVRRAGATELLRVRPRLDADHYRLGIRIVPNEVLVRPGLGRALVEGVRVPLVAQKQILAGAVDVYSGRVQAESLGPVGMGRIVRASMTGAQEARLLVTIGAYFVLIALLPLPPLPGARFWMVLAGWRGPRHRSPVAARDAGIVERPRPRFPLALLAALLPLALGTVVGAYGAATVEPAFAAIALVPIALLVALAQGHPRAWSIAILAFIPLPRGAIDPLALAISFALWLAVFVTLHVPSVRRYFGLACPVCGRVAARPVPASRRTACMACGSTWITTSA